MENIIYYSASNNGFYFEEDKTAFIDGAGWPYDAKEISQRWYNYLLNGQAKGKRIAVNEYGQPVLTIPVQDYVSQASREKASRLREATIAFTPLQDAVDIGIATTDEISFLNKWKEYRVEVYRVDVSKAPEIIWPTVPAPTNNLSK